MSQSEMQILEDQAKRMSRSAELAREEHAKGNTTAAVANYWQGRAGSLVKLVALLASERPNG